MLDDKLKTGFILGDWQVRPAENLLQSPDQNLEIEPRVMKLLVYFAGHPKIVLSKDDLLNNVWGDVVVQEDSLTKAISELRRVLGDDPRAPTMIKTIRKGGYQLIADVAPVSPKTIPAATPNNNFNWLAVIFVIAVLAILAMLLYPSSNPAQFEFQQRRITSFAGQEMDPQLSPDGKSLAFIRNDAENHYNLHIKNLSQFDSQPLTHNKLRERAPQWSPNGEKLAFTRHGEGSAQIIILDLNTKSEHIAATEPFIGQGLSWSNDGKLLYYSRRQSANVPYHLVSLDPASQQRKQLTFPPQGYDGDRAVKVDPNSGRIGFLRHNRQGAMSFNLLEADGNLTELHQEQGANLSFSWFANHWLFDRLQHGKYQLVSLDTDSGKTSPLPQLGQWSALPAVHQQQNALVYMQLQLRRDVMSQSLVDMTQAPKALLDSTQLDFDAYLSHDNSKLAYVSSASGDMQVFVSDHDGNNKTKLTDVEGHTFASPKWSPDDSQLAVQVNAQGQNNIALIDLASGQLKPILADGAINVKPAWLADGKHLLYGSDKSGQWQIWRVNLSTGITDQLTLSGGRIAKPVNQQQFAYTKQDQPGIWLFDMLNKESSLIIEDVQTRDLDNWAVHAGYIYHIRRQNDQAQLWRYAIDNGDAQQLFTLDALADVSLSLSADGHTLLYTRSTDFSSDIIYASWE